jgi:hypothetical protein
VAGALSACLREVVVEGRVYFPTAQGQRALGKEPTIRVEVQYNGHTFVGTFTAEVTDAELVGAIRGFRDAVRVN